MVCNVMPACGRVVAGHPRQRPGEVTRDGDDRVVVAVRQSCLCVLRVGRAPSRGEPVSVCVGEVSPAASRRPACDDLLVLALPVVTGLSRLTTAAGTWSVLLGPVAHATTARARRRSGQEQRAGEHAVEPRSQRCLLESGRVRGPRRSASSGRRARTAPATTVVPLVDERAQRLPSGRRPRPGSARSSSTAVDDDEAVVRAGCRQLVVRREAGTSRGDASPYGRGLRGQHPVEHHQASVDVEAAGERGQQRLPGHRVLRRHARPRPGRARPATAGPDDVGRGTRSRRVRRPARASASTPRARGDGRARRPRRRGPGSRRSSHARQPPGAVAEQGQHRGHQRHPHQERVDEHPDGEAEGHRLDRHVAVRDERGEDADHDHRGGRHHPRARREARDDRASGVAGVDVLLAHPGDRGRPRSPSPARTARPSG